MVHLAQFLGMFTDLWKVTISFVMSVCPFVCTEQIGSHWMGFHEIWYLSVLQKSVTIIRVSSKLDKNNRYFYIKTNIHFSSYLAEFFLVWEIFQTDL